MVERQARDLEVRGSSPCSGPKYFNLKSDKHDRYQCEDVGKGVYDAA